MNARELSEAIEKEAERLGVGVRFGDLAKHRVALLDDGRSTRKVIFSKTPSDHRTRQNTIHDVRRMVQEMREPAPAIVPEIVEPEPEIVRPWEIVPDTLPLQTEKPLDFLYHFTTTCHLPRILESRELIVPTYLGVRDFVWATNNGDCERTSTDKFKKGGDPYREGAMQRVRIGLHYDDFKPWREVIDTAPGWSPRMIEGLEALARERGQKTDGWYCRAEPLSLDRVIGIDTRSYKSHKWTPFDIARQEIFMGPPSEPDLMGVEIGDQIYSSFQVSENGITGYHIAKPFLLDEVLR